METNEKEVFSHTTKSPTQTCMVKIALNLMRGRRLPVYPLAPPQSEERCCKRSSGGAGKDGTPPEAAKPVPSASAPPGAQTLLSLWPGASQSCLPPKTTCRPPPRQERPIEHVHLLPPVRYVLIFLRRALARATPSLSAAPR